MSDNAESKQKELDRIAKELSASRLSRRGLLDRLKAVGVGFGAAFMLGAKQSDAHNALDASARLKSTNTALNGIIEEDRVMDATSLPKVKMPNRDGFVADPRPDVRKERRRQ